MSASMAPSRGRSFEGILFFVYDREAVIKEEDPPENAIVYFYPPSASIEERISICGQLIGMSHFMHGFLGAQPALFKLKAEKMATTTSGKYTLALGGGLLEPDSLLIRQLETLLSIFTFYHGSLDRMRMMCDSQRSFLLLMNVIWDCYLPFVRHYGEFLPGVFDPLPFLDLPKSVSATCFTKASYILQACQRRQHVLGGCILYSNSILCSQLEPCITERLLLLKPNQSNHPARPIKTEYVLPFGVRVLNAFLTLSEYLNLYEALAQSPYRKPMSAEGDGTLPDLYTLNASSDSGKGAITGQSGEGLDRRLGDLQQQQQQHPNTDSGVLSREEVGCSSVSKTNCSSSTSTNPFCCRSVVNCCDPPQETGPRNEPSETPAPDTYQHEEAVYNSNPTTCVTETSGTVYNSNPTTCVTETDHDECERTGSEIMNSSELGEENACDERMKQVQNDSSVSEKVFENRAVDDEVDGPMQDVLPVNSAAENNSSDCLTMDTIDVAELKVVQCCFPSFHEESFSDELENEKSTLSGCCKVCSCVTGKDAVVSNCTPATSCVDEETRTCALVIQDLIARVVQAAEKENASAVENIVDGYHNVAPHHQPYFAVGDATCRGGGEITCKIDNNENKTTQTKHQTGSESQADTVDDISEVVFLAQATNTQPSILNSSDEYLSVSANDSGNLDPTSKDGIGLRTELLKTPIVCDAFSSRNLNICVDKHLEKSFPISDSSSDTRFMNDSGNFSSISGKSCDSQRAEGVPVMHSLPSLMSVEPVPVVHVAAVESDSFAVHTTLEGTDEIIDAAQEETEDICADNDSPLDSGRASDTSVTPDEELLFYEEEGNGANQVEGLTHINLYVQAHSHVVLILLAEDMLYSDFNTVKALWETSLNELGELEFMVTQSLDKPPKPTLTDDYSFLVYDSFERNMQGSVGEPVFQLDHLFCETTKVMYEQFDNCPSLKDISLRSRSSVMHGKRNLGRGTYFHLKGLHRAVQGIPSPRDPAWKLEKKAAKVLHKDHNVNVF